MFGDNALQVLNRHLPAGKVNDPCPKGRVSITPLQIDLTRYAQVEGVRSWLGLNP